MDDVAIDDWCVAIVGGILDNWKESQSCRDTVSANTKVVRDDRLFILLFCVF